MIRPIWFLLITKNTGLNLFSAKSFSLEVSPILAFIIYAIFQHFQALIFQNLCNSKKVEHFSGMFAACQHAYLSPLKLNLCSNGMDH